MSHGRGPDPADATLVPTDPSGTASDPARTRAAPTPGTHLPGVNGPVVSGAVQAVVAGYEIVKEIGRGGMGVVYKARQVSLNRPVALKMILAGFQAGPRDRARFRSEAAAAARVQHPHIVQVYEVGEEAGRAYLALELVEGTTLQDKLVGAPQPTRPAAHLVELLARAVHHAHQCGVVHRDLKPGNVLLAPAPPGSPGLSDPAAAQAAALYGVPKITDFGLAKRMGEDDGQTRSGDLLGTPSYMAPEQAAGRASAAGPGADVYALGAILYEMLTGRPPFRGATPLETLQQVLNDDPVSPGRLRPKLPRDLERICLKCLEKDPRKRYATAQDLADDLRRHLNGESVHARPAPVPERVWRWCRRNPAAAGLFVVAVLGSSFGLWYLSWLTDSVVRSTAVQGAAQQSETLDELNKYYTKVANHSPGAKLPRGWEDTPGAVPSPATLTIELGDQITARTEKDAPESGTRVRLFSDYPFKNRTDGGPRDDFERDALAQLRENPEQPYYRFEEVGGRSALRYATARVMVAQCVSCHNNHPLSTKRDWQVGDLRGVLEVIRPLDRDQQRVSQGLRGTALLIGGLGIGAILLSAVTLSIGGRRHGPSADPPPESGGSNPGGPDDPTGPNAQTYSFHHPPGDGPPNHTPRGGPTMPDPRLPDPGDATLAPSQSPPPPAPKAAADPEATQETPPAFDRSAPGDATLPATGPVIPARPAPPVKPAPAAERTRVPAAETTEATLVPPRPAPRPAPSAPTPPPAARDASATDADMTGDLSAGTGPASETDATRSFAPPAAKPSGPASGGGRPKSVHGLALGAAVDRFVLRGLHARGGLGEVYTARDTELNREVALKRIQARYADDPSSRRRFLTEAEITARLDHPGVVPVFGLVADGNGRPCYAMRFIRGESLRDEIERYHGKKGASARTQETDKTEAAGTLPGQSVRAAAARGGAAPQSDDDRRLAFRQILQRFVAVCQAIAYAHSRKVIHRDIKPANVMVGTFGETLVVDWGLAKALDDVPSAEALHRAADRANFRRDADATEVPDDVTVAGTAVGTPAYMSPEQAAGELDRMGPASDIFSLGATLYCVLTGRAPFGGGAPSETLKLVQKAAFTPPAQVNPEVPAPLDAVCRKAMAARPEDRYATAQDLATDVERWLSDEPVSCHRDPLPARLARWARRHPARVAGSVSLLGAGLVATAAILFVVDRARTQTESALNDTQKAQAETKVALEQETEAKAATQAALSRVSEEQKRTEEQRQAAVAAGDLARARFALARNAFETTVLGIQSRLEDRAGTQRLRQELLQTAQDGLRKLLDTAANTAGADRRDADRLMFWARLQMGDVRRGLGDTAAALTEYGAAVAVAEKTLKDEPGSAEARNALAAGYDRLADIDLQSGKTAAAFEGATKALALRERLVEAAPADKELARDLAASRDRLAAIELERGNTREAKAASAESLKARRALHDADPTDARLARDLAQSYDRDAEILLRAGDTAGAGAAVKDLLALREAVAKAQPDRTEAQRELAAAYSRLGEVSLDRAEVSAALKAYRSALSVLDAALAKDPLSAGAKLDAATARGRVGFVLLRTGDAPAALEETRRSTALGREVVAADPTSAKARRALAHGLGYLGDALLANGRTADAVKEYDAARVALADIAGADAGSVGARLDLADGLERLGTAQLAANDTAAATAALEQSAELRGKVVTSDPGSARARRELAVSREKLCDAYLAAGRPDRALDTVYQALATFRELAAQDPASGRAKRDLAAAYAKWADVTLGGGDATATMILLHKSSAAFDDLAKLDPSNAQAQEDRAAALERLASVNALVGYPDARLAAERQALAIREKLAAAHPDSPAAHRGVMTGLRRVGDALADQRRYAAALKAYKDARAVAEKFGGGPAFTRESETLADHTAVVEAVEAGLKNPAELAAAPRDVRARALRLLIAEHLRRREPMNATRAANLLTQAARGPDDWYAAAKAYMEVADRMSADSRKPYTDAALAVLAHAADTGFRDAAALKDAVWDPVRDEPAFKAAEAKVKANPPPIPAPRAK